MILKTENILALFIFATAAYFFPNNYWRSVWWDKWFFLMLTLTGFVSFKMGKRFHYSVGISLFIALASALWVFGWRMSYPNVDMVTLLAIGKVTTYTFSSLLLISFTLYFFDTRHFTKMGDLFSAICVVNSAIIIIQALTHIDAQARGGMFGNPSMSGCLIAFTYPFLCFQDRIVIPHPSIIAFTKRFFYVVAPIIAIFLTRTSQPAVVLLVVSLVYFWHSHSGKEPLKWTLIFSGILVVLTAIGMHHFVNPHKGSIFHTSGRFTIWGYAMQAFAHSHRQWLGHGTGISQILIPLIEQQHLEKTSLPVKVDWWLWFHSDWLQLLFENGFWGLIFGVFMFYTALKKAGQKASWLLASLVGVGLTSVANFTAHFPIHAFMGATIIAMSFDREYLSNSLFKKEDTKYRHLREVFNNEI